MLMAQAVCGFSATFQWYNSARLFLTILPLLLNPFQTVLTTALVPFALISCAREFESCVGDYTDQWQRLVTCIWGARYNYLPGQLSWLTFFVVVLMSSRQMARIIPKLCHDRTERPEAVGPTHLPIQWVPGFFLSGVKGPGRDVDHSSSCNADVKNEWSVTLVSPVCLHGMDRYNFAFFMIQFLDVVQS